MDKVRRGLRRVASSDLAFAWKHRRARARDTTVLLTYHTLGRDDEAFDAWTVVRRDDFLRQVAAIRRHYDIVSIDQALTIDEPAAVASRTRPRVVLTFDDGHSGWHDHLLPIAEREALPVTLYVATGHIEHAQPYWFDRIMNAVQVDEPLRIDLSPHGLGVYELGRERGEGNWRVIDALLEGAKGLNDDARREAVVRSIEVAVAGRRRRDVDALEPLSLDRLRAVAASRWVTIGAHSDDHRLLDKIPLDAAEASMRTAKQKLESWLNVPVRLPEWESQRRVACPGRARRVCFGGHHRARCSSSRGRCARVAALVRRPLGRGGSPALGDAAKRLIRRQRYGASIRAR
jgi:peptidoglycan/xylan/chitin deacetylase (PgdA/CDA1 family)